MNQAANLAMFACKRAKPSYQLKDLIKRSIHDVNYRGRLTIRFKDTSYHPKDGGFHPVSITIDMKDSHIAIREITDRVYVGDETPELVPDLTFDFANNIAFARFSGWLGMHLQETTELYEMWECNFLAYVAMDAYNQIQIKCG
ncbi:DUF2787 domain-containing protein [Vibrio diabolicus]|uniref:DUF2787 domain-containing protein n=1 Tax=Vibrio diabolicus TaxID=50719 RepID=UPI002160443E|nr:DUF2787 domain-containing protein [Vibrio diabolicus]EIE9609365.1 DUF2787 family protein [Vibrio parahaemolyticus]EJE4707497.1 DUF2787 family protein [Vibrio parahaemolyticus]MCS0317308.1 DUF2787 domain-containing protein [Vibrio diabolicus]